MQMDRVGKIKINFWRVSYLFWTGRWNEPEWSCNNDVKACRGLINEVATNQRSNNNGRFDSKYIKLTIIHTYAPTLDAEDEDKELFYEQLQSIVEKVNKDDHLTITGDINAKVGSSNHNRERVMAKHGAGILNSNGERLIDFCEMNNLVITGTIFPHKDIHKNTWTSSDGKTHNQIDHILVNQQFRRSILDTRVRQGADVASDHHLVQTRGRLKLKRITKSTSSRIRYDVNKLRHETVRKEFTLELRNRFTVLEATEDDDRDINSKWAQYSKAYNNTAENVLGRKRKSSKPWIP